MDEPNSAVVRKYFLEIFYQFFLPNSAPIPIRVKTANFMLIQKSRKYEKVFSFHHLQRQFEMLSGRASPLLRPPQLLLHHQLDPGDCQHRDDGRQLQVYNHCL